jgi:nucleoside-diphosphate-sugar epimerase
VKRTGDFYAGLREPLRGRGVCVTGGAGFIGGHLVDALLDCGARVTVIDDLSAGDGDRLGSVVESAEGSLRFVYGSVLDRVALAEAVEGVSVVFHLAALASVPMSLEMPERFFAVNGMGTVRVLEASREAGVERVVYSASSASYGDAGGARLGEDLAVRALSPYAASKAAGEHAVMAYARSMGLDGVSLRYFNVFGPRQRADSAYAAAVPSFFRAVRDGERPVIFGDGSATRDFVAVADAVRANLLAATLSGALGGAVVNIGSGEATSVRALAGMVARLAGRGDLEPRFEAARAGDIEHSVADIGRARSVLGYEPAVTLEEGLLETAASFGVDGASAARA